MPHSCDNEFKNLKECFFDTTNDGFWDWYIKDDYEYMSPRFWEILGFEPHEKKHHPSEWFDLIFEEDLKVALEIFDKHVASKGIHPYNLKVRYKHKDGSTVYIICRGSVIEWDDDGSPIRMIGTHTDVTEREHLINNLEDSNNALDQFAHIISHDLKEPLRGIYNQAYFVKEDAALNLGEKEQERLDRVMALAKHMEEQISNLHLYSKIGQQELVFGPVPIKDLLESVIKPIRQTYENKVLITVQDNLPTISCDPVRVETLLRNLIYNGIKYNTNEQKAIEIGMQKKPNSNQQVFYVKDNGIGIEKGDFENIFKLFKRLDQSGLREEGTGSGLAFVKQAVEQHGGKIWIESTIGEGTTFLFTLTNTE